MLDARVADRLFIEIQSLKVWWRRGGGSYTEAAQLQHSKANQKI